MERAGGESRRGIADHGRARRLHQSHRTTAGGRGSASTAAAIPPPIDLTGRWRLTAAGSGGCFMNFGHAPAAAQGTIAPEGGCPGNFFTSRKWTFEHGALIIRDHKSEALAELSFAGGRFEGHQTGGGALSLAR